MNEEIILWDISIYGDQLELNASTFIKSQLPAYELTWKSYIGHQGSGQMALMTNISEALEIQRKDFSEYHYTILESLYFMERIKNENEFVQVIVFDEYVSVLNQLMLYQVYAGRIRDNFRHAFDVLNKPDLSEKARIAFDEFYSQRHVFVHQKKVPFSFDEYRIFHTAEPKRSTTSSHGFGKDMLWNDVTIDGMVSLDDYLKNSMQELVSLVNSHLSIIYDVVKIIIKDNNLILTSPPKVLHGISGYSGYSGQTQSNQIISGSCGQQDVSHIEGFNTSGRI